MKCLDREKLFAFTQGMLEGREAENAQAHVAGCETCRYAAEGYRRLDTVLDEWKPAEPTPWFDARVRQAVAAAPSEHAGFLSRAVGARRLVLAAALAAVVIAASLLWMRAQRSAQTTQPVAQQPAPQVAPAQAPKPPQELAQAPTQKVETAQANRAVLKTSEETITSEEETAEDYDMLANFDVLSELAPGEKRIAN